MTMPARSRTASSLSSTGSNGSALSFFAICSSCSHRSRFRVSQTLPTAPTWLYGRRRKGQRSVGKNLSLDDNSIRTLGPSPQPFARSYQALGIVPLFSSTGGAVHDPHGQGRHRGVQPSQLGQKLTVLPHHWASPCKLRPMLSCAGPPVPCGWPSGPRLARLSSLCTCSPPVWMASSLGWHPGSRTSDWDKRGRRLEGGRTSAVVNPTLGPWVTVKPVGAGAQSTDS